jgi:hypothetical protein
VTSGFPIQPDVKLKKLAFYDVLGTLLQPSTLMPASQARQQEGTYYFHLTPQQATDIAMNRDIRNPAKPEYLIQVQLRFCLLETTSEQEDCFPPNVQVKVNGKLCQLPVSVVDLFIGDLRLILGGFFVFFVFRTQLRQTSRAWNHDDHRDPSTSHRTSKSRRLWQTVRTWVRMCKIGLVVCV